MLPSQQRDLLASDQMEGAPLPWGQGSRKGRRGRSPHAQPRSTVICPLPQSRSLRGQNVGDTQALPREAVCFQRKEGSTELSEILRIFSCGCKPDTDCAVSRVSSECEQMGVE